MTKRTNILLITADELRADALGCYGSEICRTPNLDNLARNGVVFDNAFTPNPICIPARASITTGNYPFIATGRKDNSGCIGQDQVKLAEHFSSHGYETYACGKLHYVPYAPPDQPRLEHGFDHVDLTESGRIAHRFDPEGKQRGLEEYLDDLADAGWAGWSRAHGSGMNDVRPSCPTPLPDELHVDHWVADRTIHRLGEHVENHPDKPFMIWCSFPKPHPPFDPPGQYANMYDPREMPAPLGDVSMLEGRNTVLYNTRMALGVDSLSPAAMKTIKAYYYGLVTHQDAQVGRVLATLKNLGLDEQTIIIYTADHGELLGDFGTYFKKSFLKGSVSVPFIMKTPDGPAGQRREQLIGLQDILPSLANMTNCPLGQDVQGLDITEVFADAHAKGRDIYYSQTMDAPRQSAMITDGHWKYCYAQEGAIEELYNLDDDPDELINLAQDAQAEALVTSWRHRLIQEARRFGDTNILVGDGLATSPIDRSALDHLTLGVMGWQWF